MLGNWTVVRIFKYKTTIFIWKDFPPGSWWTHTDPDGDCWQWAVTIPSCCKITPRKSMCSQQLRHRRLSHLCPHGRKSLWTSPLLESRAHLLTEPSSFSCLAGLQQASNGCSLCRKALKVLDMKCLYRLFNFFLNYQSPSTNSSYLSKGQKFRQHTLKKKLVKT